LLVATHNQGKVREYRELLADLPLEVTYLDAEGITVDVEETGATFTENAILKARSMPG
jgi:XTP/dITP diphosphohydrolase